MRQIWPAAVTEAKFASAARGRFLKSSMDHTYAGTWLSKMGGKRKRGEDKPVNRSFLFLRKIKGREREREIRVEVLVVESGARGGS